MIDDEANCVRVADSDHLYIAFAVRSDVAPADGLTDMEETGSGLRQRQSFIPSPSDALIFANVPASEGVPYQIYASQYAWRVDTGAGFLGEEWTLR